MWTPADTCICFDHGDSKNMYTIVHLLIPNRQYDEYICKICSTTQFLVAYWYSTAKLNLVWEDPVRGDPCRHRILRGFVHGNAFWQSLYSQRIRFIAGEHRFLREFGEGGGRHHRIFWELGFRLRLEAEHADTMYHLLYVWLFTILLYLKIAG